MYTCITPTLKLHVHIPSVKPSLTVSSHHFLPLFCLAVKNHLDHSAIAKDIEAVAKYLMACLEDLQVFFTDEGHYRFSGGVGN